MHTTSHTVIPFRAGINTGTTLTPTDLYFSTSQQVFDFDQLTPIEGLYLFDELFLPAFGQGVQHLYCQAVGIA